MLGEPGLLGTLPVQIGCGQALQESHTKNEKPHPEPLPATNKA